MLYTKTTSNVWTYQSRVVVSTRLEEQATKQPSVVTDSCVTLGKSPPLCFNFLVSEKENNLCFRRRLKGAIYVKVTILSNSQH